MIRKLVKGCLWVMAGLVLPAIAQTMVPTLKCLTGETLHPGITAIGKAYGVRARCGPNAAGRRMFLYPEERPFQEIKRQLADFASVAPGAAHWYREGETHVFDEDLAGRQARVMRGKKWRAQAVQKRKAGVERMVKWARPEATANEPEGRARGRIGNFLMLYSSLPAEARGAASSGKPVQVPVTRLSPGAQQFVYGELGSRYSADTQVSLTPHGSPDAPGLRITLMGSNGGGPTIRDIVNPPKWDPSEGWDWLHHQKSYLVRTRGPKDRQTNELLRRQITLKGGPEQTIEMVLAQLAEQASLPLIGDYDPCYANPYNRKSSSQITLIPGYVVKQPVWRALDLVCERFDLDWELEQTWLRIRSPRTVPSWSGEMDLSPPPEAPVRGAN